MSASASSLLWARCPLRCGVVATQLPDARGSCRRVPAVLLCALVPRCCRGPAACSAHLSGAQTPPCPSHTACPPGVGGRSARTSPLLERRSGVLTPPPALTRHRNRPVSPFHSQTPSLSGSEPGAHRAVRGHALNGFAGTRQRAPLPAVCSPRCRAVPVHVAGALCVARSCVCQAGRTAPALPSLTDRRAVRPGCHLCLGIHSLLLGSRLQQRLSVSAQV